MLFSEIRWRNYLTLVLLWLGLAWITLGLITLFNWDIPKHSRLGINILVKLMDTFPRFLQIMFIGSAAAAVIALSVILIGNLGKRRSSFGDVQRLLARLPTLLRGLFYIHLLFFAFFSIYLPPLMLFKFWPWLLLNAIVLGRLIHWTKYKPNVRVEPASEISRRAYWLGLGGAIFVYFLLTLKLGYYLYWNLGMDGLAYYQIAQRYADGEFVVRGQWSPLISWLMAPFIAAGLEAELTSKILMGLIGLLWFAIMIRLGKRIGLNNTYLIALAFFLAIFIPIFSEPSEGIRSDPLSTVLILAYLFVTLKPSRSIRQAVAAGVLAALAYYARAYNLPFILGHAALTLVLQSIHGYAWRQSLRFYLIVALILIVLAAPWLVSLHARHGFWTLSTGSEVNRALLAPGQNQNWITCLTGFRLCDQPDDVMFPWEDLPPNSLPAYGWSPFGSLSNLRYQIILFNSNVLGLTSFSAYPLGWTFVIGLFALMIYWQDRRKRYLFSWILTTSAFYASGYLMMYEIFRYYLVSVSLLILLLLYLLQELPSRKVLSPLQYGLILLLPFFGAFSYMAPGEITSIFQPGQDNGAKCARDDSIALRDYLIAPIAGTNTDGEHNGAGSIIDISYYTEIRSYGSLSPKYRTLAEIDQTLREYKVRTLISSDAETTDTLIERYDFERVVDVTICDDPYTILRVPSAEHR